MRERGFDVWVGERTKRKKGVKVVIMYIKHGGRMAQSPALFSQDVGERPL